MNSVYVSGLGAVSCVGANREELWKSCLNQKSGIVDGLGKIPLAVREKLSVHPKQNSPLAYATSACREALSQADWKNFNSDDGFILATTTALVSTWDEPLMRFFKEEISQETLMTDFRNEKLGILFDQICDEISFHGRRQLLTTACSAATHALGLATLWLKTGRVKRVLVMGVEVISTLTISGFKSFQLLSDETCRPFNQGRKGINLSDGAAALCLETESTNALAEVAGVGFSTDAYHMTAPHPEGKGSLQAMRSAIHMASILPSDISWVHAHGTGSEHNDLSEGIALERLFEGKPVPVTSTKAIHGHSLAASGALESVLCVQALQNQTVLPTYGLEKIDERLKIQIANEAKLLEIRYVLKNTLGFGGANGALVFKRIEKTA